MTKFIKQNYITLTIQIAFLTYIAILLIVK